MSITSKTFLIGTATFIVAMPFYTLFFWWALDQSTTAAIALSVSPALISAGAVARAVHRKQADTASDPAHDASRGG